MTTQTNIRTFTDADFQQEVLKSDRPVLIDFWADWCQPCHMLAPTIEEIADQYEGRVKVGTLDVDANPKTAGAYGIRSIPSVLVFGDGEVTESIVGVNPKQAYVRALDRVTSGE